MFHFWIGVSSLYGAYNGYCKNEYLQFSVRLVNDCFLNVNQIAP